MFDVILYSLIGSYALLFIVFMIWRKNFVKPLTLIYGGLFLLYVALRLIFSPTKIKDYESLSEFGIIVSALLLVAIAIILTFAFDKKKYENNSSMHIAYAGICVALSYALSFIKIEFLGGSITLASALPLIIYAYVFGAKKGLLTGIIFGVLQFIQKPTVYHYVQVLLDYPIAFGLIGLSGIVKDFNVKPIVKFIISASIGLFGRYVAHVLSGYFVFFIFAENMNPLAYSIVYNMNVLVDLAIVLFIGSFLFTSKSFIIQLDRIQNKTDI